MKTFQLAFLLALAVSATASSTARPFGKYNFHDAGSEGVPTDITVNVHLATLDAHIAGCARLGVPKCFDKANFACFGNAFRMDGDKLLVDDLQKKGCLKDNMNSHTSGGYEYEMSYNAAEDSIAVLLVAAHPGERNQTIVLQNTAPRKNARTPTPPPTNSTGWDAVVGCSGGNPSIYAACWEHTGKGRGQFATAQECGNHIFPIPPNPGTTCEQGQCVLYNGCGTCNPQTCSPQSSDFHVPTPKASNLRGSLARGKSTAAEVHQTIKGQCADGWLCVSGSAVLPGGCERAPAFELQVVFDEKGAATLTLPADGHPYDPCSNPKGICSYNLEGQWRQANWSEMFLGTVMPGRADGKTTVSIVESHMAAGKNSLVFTTFSGASGMHTQNCTVYY